MTVLKVQKKILKEVDKTRSRFLWAQEDELTGGKCNIAWGKVCSPLDRGGLDILDLQKFGRALRLRWLWLAWRHPTRPWVGFQLPCDEGDQAAFAEATAVMIGNCKTTLFWSGNWIGGRPLKLSFPSCMPQEQDCG